MLLHHHVPGNAITSFYDGGLKLAGTTTKQFSLLIHLSRLERPTVTRNRKALLDQWQNGYPNAEAVRSDLTEGAGYVMETERCVDGYACISFNGEPCYADLQGEWLSLQPNVVIHRMVIRNDCKGKGPRVPFSALPEAFAKDGRFTA